MERKAKGSAVSLKMVSMIDFSTLEVFTVSKAGAGKKMTAISLNGIGRGAYFADDPKKSHEYTASDPTDGTYVMYYNKVLLGTPSTLTAPNRALFSAPKGCHSVIGKHDTLTEYIVYRYGQALPRLKIVYKA